MKVLFAGPSLHGARLDLSDLDVRGPAAQGDIANAVHDGATMVGLVDGLFGSIASVWHKEILAALDAGVAVLGASSMGALRAAECADFGMIPIGVIADSYLHGALNDDAAVALQFAPAEFDWVPLTEPLVDVWPTLIRLRANDAITPTEFKSLKQSAEQLHFTERTPERMVIAAGLDFRRHEILRAYEKYRVSQKQLDALELISAMRHASFRRESRHWDFSQSPMWRKFLRTTHG